MKDHLGNNRVTFQVSTTNGVTSYTVKNTTDFYPFGMEFKNQGSSNFNTYLFGGKEIDRMQGLMEYDFGARWYDPIIGRWGTLDPMAEDNYSQTPYKYSNNNPENYIDPDGREERTDMWGNVIALLNDVPYGTDYAKSIYIDPNGNIEGVGNILPEVTVTALYVMTDSNQGARDRAASYGSSFLPFQGVAVQSTNVEMVNAWVGNFIGPGPNMDPYKIPDPVNKGQYLQPKNVTDAAAQKHDYAYWKLQANGVTGALFDLSTASADGALVKNCYAVMANYVNGGYDKYTKAPISYKTFIEAQAIVTAFGAISSYKFTTNAISNTLSNFNH